MPDIPTLDRRGLRDFGLLMGSIVMALFGLALPWLFDAGYPYWPWVLGGVFMVLALARPQLLAPVYRVWMRFGLALNRITTPLILGIVYFLVITPTGLVMRLFRRDPLARRFDEERPSYRVQSNQAPKDNMERPF